jgi:soluble lytic murein transglycosylase
MFAAFILSTFISFASLAASSEKTEWQKFIDRPELKVTRADMIVYDHFLQIYKVAEKGYASAYLLDKGLKESAKNPRLAIFHEWLSDLKRFPTLEHDSLLQTCQEMRTRLKTSFGMARKLLAQRLVYCRQVALQQMAPLSLASGGITVAGVSFLKRFMHNFLYGKNRGDFLWFMQKIENRDEMKQILSTLIAEHVVNRKRQVPRDILPLLVITPDLTRHIQNFGLDSESTKQVFYSEYSRMIEQAYRGVDAKNKEQVVKLMSQMDTWLKLNLARLPVDTTLGRYSDLGKNLWRNGYDDIAQKIFDFVAANGNTEQREDAQFFRFWMWASKDKWKEAISWAKSQKLIENYKKLGDSRLKYWIAEGHQRIGDGDEARDMWEHLISRHSLSFYAIMTAKSLQTHHPKSQFGQFYLRTQSATPFTLKAEEIDSTIWESWRRLRAWSRLDAKNFLAAELKGLDKIFIPGVVSRASHKDKAQVQSDAYLLSAGLVGSEENYLESFKVVYAALDRGQAQFNRFLLEVLYPKPYYSELQTALKKVNLDPLVVLSLIRQESVFNPEARSRVGARGLMQLMPTTARRLQRSVRDKHLTIPKTNIEIGAKYFQQLHRRYDGNLVYVLAAYNAGESRVERWKDVYFTGEEMLPNIESIPFLETRNYVKLIFRNLYFYKTLEGKAESRDPATLNQIYDVGLGFKR